MRVSMTSSMCKTREITGTVLEAQRKGLRLRNYLLKGAIGSPEAMRLKIDTALQIQNIEDIVSPSSSSSSSSSSTLLFQLGASCRERVCLHTAPA